MRRECCVSVDERGMSGLQFSPLHADMVKYLANAGRAGGSVRPFTRFEHANERLAGVRKASCSDAWARLASIPRARL
jgi:hypothetical protein